MQGLVIRTVRLSVVERVGTLRRPLIALLLLVSERTATQRDAELMQHLVAREDLELSFALQHTNPVCLGQYTGNPECEQQADQTTHRGPVTLDWLNLEGALVVLGNERKWGEKLRTIWDVPRLPIAA